MADTRPPPTRRPRSSMDWTHGTSLFAQLNQPTQPSAPRRRVSRVSSVPTEVAIFEDAENGGNAETTQKPEKAETTSFTATQKAPSRKASLSGRTLSELSRRQSTTSQSTTGTSADRTLNSGKVTRRSSRTSFAGVRAKPTATDSTASMAVIAEDDSTQIFKEPRRRTMWVPSEGTTVISVHPGIKDLHDDESRGQQQDRSDPNQPYTSSRNESQHGNPQQIESQNSLSNTATQDPQLSATARLRRPKRTSLLAAPRRVPLQPTMLTVQETYEVEDRDGRLTGKENVAPGHELVSGTSKDTTQTKVRPLRAPRRSSILFGKTANANLAPALAPTEEAVRCISMKRPISPREGSPKVARLADGSRAIVGKALDYSKDLVEGHEVQVIGQSQPDGDRKDTQQPLQTNTTPFEESWLQKQETVLVELINDIFAQHCPPSRPLGPHKFHTQLQRHYESRPQHKLRQRLQASLQFGTLSLSRDTDSTVEAYRFGSDTGRRDRFIKLWTQSYSKSFLRAGLEVVTGRHIQPESASASPTSGPKTKTQLTSRDITNFIDTFLLQNKDTPHTSDFDPARAWRRTLLRSLCLIYLLDQAKDNLNLSGNLFRRGSAYKSSLCVLEELCIILHPLGRSAVPNLTHLDYRISHSQSPLAEFSWPVTNLATDLRDGVRLTRLVECILPVKSRELLAEDGMISAQDGVYDTPESNDRRTSSSSLRASDTNNLDPFLSAHLRHPCTDAAGMLANNELALNALRTCDADGLHTATKTTTPADLVDGHREKTVALLWRLLAESAAGRVVDAGELRGEIARVGRLTGTSNSRSDPREEALASTNEEQDSRALLLEWTRVVAARHGLSLTPGSGTQPAKPNRERVHPAHPRVLEALVDEYAPLIHHEGTFLSQANLTTASGNTLEDKLRSIGCSSTFATLFSQTDSDLATGLSPPPSQSQSHSQSQPNQTAPLFLASRLLNASKSMRAHLSTSRGLAQSCAEVVNTRAQLNRAVRVIQRAWRAYAARASAIQARSDAGLAKGQTGATKDQTGAGMGSTAAAIDATSTPTADESLRLRRFEGLDFWMV